MNQRAFTVSLALIIAFCVNAFSQPLPQNSVYNVKKFGALGDGKNLDSKAINAAIDKAATAGGGTVYLPAGNYLSGSIHLKNNIALYIDQGATIIATDQNPASAYDQSEQTVNTVYQDYGHSHFHNSLIWGEDLHDVSILGPGMIWGKGLINNDRDKNSKEAIFDVQYKSGGVGQGNSWPNSFAPQNSGNAVIQFGGGGNNAPTDDLVNEYEAGDQRKAATVATSYVNAGGVTIPGNFVKKYYDVPVTANDNGNNIPVIRYADVILMYAECLNEAGYVAGGEAFTYLNNVRNRAGLNSLTGTEVPNQAAFRLAMEHERRVEFAFENLRWYDLVRTDRAITVINGKSASINLVNPVTQQNLVFPIPQSQIDINKTKITQNEGAN